MTKTIAFFRYPTKILKYNFIVVEPYNINTCHQVSFCKYGSGAEAHNKTQKTRKIGVKHGAIVLENFFSLSSSIKTVLTKQHKTQKYERLYELVNHYFHLFLKSQS